MGGRAYVCLCVSKASAVQAKAGLGSFPDPAHFLGLSLLSLLSGFDDHLRCTLKTLSGGKGEDSKANETWGDSREMCFWHLLCRKFTLVTPKGPQDSFLNEHLQLLILSHTCDRSTSQNGNPVR